MIAKYYLIIFYHFLFTSFFFITSFAKSTFTVLKALFNFIAVPVITFFGIFVGNALLRAIDDATAGGTNVKMSDIVMTSIATNALRAEHQGNSLNYELISKNTQNFLFRIETLL